MIKIIYDEYLYIIIYNIDINLRKKGITLMMQILSVKEILNNYKDIKTVNLQGWVKTNRNNGSFGFIDFNDGSSLKNIQLVYKQENTKNYDQIKGARTGSAIQISGAVVLTPNAKQPFEILVDDAQVLAQANEDYPLQKKRHTNEFLREIAHLRPRTNLFNAIMRIRSKLFMILNSYFQTNDFIWVASPELTCTDAEGNGEAFKLALVDKQEFFNTEVSLSGTGQLHAEAYAMAFKKVYSFAPQFRAEKSHTNRHAAEFWMLEPEVQFMDINGLMDLMQDMMKYIISQYQTQCEDEINFLNEFVDQDLINRLNKISKNEFVKLDYTKAIEMLINAKNEGHEFENSNIHWGMDLESEHERYLCEHVFNAPTFIYNYPASLKAFYMKLNDDNKTVAGVDLLVPGVGELCGGSEREANYETLLKKAQAVNMPINGIDWYLDLRKYGYFKSAGFGLGFERLIMYLTGISNIRDTIPFPRTHGSIKY